MPSLSTARWTLRAAAARCVVFVRVNAKDVRPGLRLRELVGPSVRRSIMQSVGRLSIVRSVECMRGGDATGPAAKESAGEMTYPAVVESPKHSSVRYVFDRDCGTLRVSRLACSASFFSRFFSRFFSVAKINVAKMLTRNLPKCCQDCKNVTLGKLLHLK